MLEYTVHAAAAGVRALGAPVANQTTVVGSGVESHASFAPIGARMAERALDEAAVAIATELVVAMRALRIRGTEPSGMPACELYERAAAVLDSNLEDRPLAGDVEAARRLLLEDAGARTRRGGGSPPSSGRASACPRRRELRRSGRDEDRRRSPRRSHEVPDVQADDARGVDHDADHEQAGDPLEPEA